MITRVVVHNFKSIGDCDIDFKKGKYKYLEDMIYKDTIVNPIGFYGTNGSGKSSFLKIFRDLAFFMFGEVDHLPILETNAIWGNELLEKLKRNERTIDFNDFEPYVKIFFTLNKKQYEYCICTSIMKMIKYEYLKCGDDTIFNRGIDNYEYKGSKEKLEMSLYPLLRKFVQVDKIEDEDINSAYSFLSSIAFVDVDANMKGYISKDLIWKRSVDLMVEQSDKVKEILEKYNSFPKYSINARFDKDTGEKITEATLYLGNNKQVNLSLNQISAGMYNQSILLSIITTLPENSVLVVDELENALHPTTILNFLQVIKEKNIQLIFSSHNTFILSNLRPDQIIFANWKDGFSTYKKLCDIYPNIREVNNIERMYLSNLFDDGIKA